MELKNLTSEQAIEIAKLIFPFSLKSGYETFYQPYDESHYSDAIEYYLVSFYGIIVGDRVGKIRVFIYSNLDCDIDYYYEDENGKMNINTVRRLPVRNQREIQKKFTEFGF